MNFGQRERVERGLAVILTAASAIARWTQRSLIGLLLALGVTQALAQSAAVPQPYTEVFYPSGPLRIQAYLYRPPGDGPFPLVIYNHGSRANSEREPRPFSYVGRILLGSGLLIAMSAEPAFAQKQGGTLKLSHFDSPASMSILEESTVAALRPVMGVFNNLVMYRQDVAQTSVVSRVKVYN